MKEISAEQAQCIIGMFVAGGALGMVGFIPLFPHLGANMGPLFGMGVAGAAAGCCVGLSGVGIQNYCNDDVISPPVPGVMGAEEDANHDQAANVQAARPR